MGKQVLSFGYSSGDPVTLIIEPWAEEIEINAETKIDIDIHFRENGIPFITIDQGYLILYLWKTCTCKAYINGQEIVIPSLMIPHP